MLDDYELPTLPTEDERTLAQALGAARLQSIDDAITKAAQARWLKVARVFTTH